MSNKKIAITGLGMVTSLGAGTALNWEAMLAGKSGVRRVSFDASGLPVEIAACVQHPRVDPNGTILQRARELGDLALDEALRQARLPSAPFPGEFFIAPPCRDLEWNVAARRVQASRQTSYDGLCEHIRQHEAPSIESFEHIGAHYARRHQLTRIPLCMTTACASGATAVQYAVEAIRRGECKAAVALGTDGPVRPEMLSRFALLQALSTANAVPEAASRPFSKSRDGFVLGEGAGALVLEDPEHARARGAEILGYVLGSGEAGDSFHRTRSEPSGAPIAQCIERALRDAGVEAGMVDYVNAHGTSTPENDKMEALGLRLALGAAATQVAVSSIKSMIGHTIHAAGAIEAVSTVMSLATGKVPPTINYHDPDPEIALNVVGNVARDLPMRVAISNSFGFGGQNVCLVFGGAT